MVYPSVQTMVLPDIQIGHPESMAEAYKPDPDSPMFVFASVSAKLLKDAARETVPTPAQGMSLEIQVPSVDLEIPSRELSPYPDPK